MKILRTRTLIALALALGILSASAKEAQDTSTTKTSDVNFWKSVYEQNHVVELEISLTKEAWKKMQPAQSERGGHPPRGSGRPNRPGGPPPRGEAGRPPRGPGGPPPGGGGRGGAETKFEYVKASISIDGEKFKDAGLRFKGNSSYRFSADGFKRPLKIDTNRFVDGQQLHGRTKFNLSNSYLDPAFMKEKLAYGVYQAAGIPTPGTGWAKVTLSIEGGLEKTTLGIYVLIEQVNEDYLVRKFGEKSQGSLLMKPEVMANWQKPVNDTDQYKEAFNIKSGGDDKEQIQQFGEFLSFINESSDADFETQIGDKLDLDRFAGYLAATSLLASLDSYVAAPHNYYLVVNKTDHKTRLLPWDVNEAFGTFSMGTTPEALTEWAINRPWIAEIPLLERLFSTKSFPKLYQKKLKILMEDAFTEKNLFSRIDTYAQALKPHLGSKELTALRLGIEGDKSGRNTAVTRDVFAIKPFLKRRIESVKKQLAGQSDGVQIEGRRGGPPGGPSPQRQER